MSLIASMAMEMVMVVLGSIEVVVILLIDLMNGQTARHSAMLH